jgi:hypothetical protein
MEGKWAIRSQVARWSHKMMIYRLVTYDKKTERMAGTRPIPWANVTKIKKLTGVTPQDDGLGEYLLDVDQIRRISEILDFDPQPESYYYYLEPYDQPDDGLRQATAEIR